MSTGLPKPPRVADPAKALDAIRKALGLPSDASGTAIRNALNAAPSKSALAAIRKALGLAADASASEIANALSTLVDGTAARERYRAARARGHHVVVGRPIDLGAASRPVRRLAASTPPVPADVLKNVRAALGLPPTADKAAVFAALDAAFAAETDAPAPAGEDVAMIRGERRRVRQTATPHLGVIVDAVRLARDEARRTFATMYGPITLSPREMAACAEKGARPETYAARKAAQVAARGPMR